jgi:hypothetical protein
MSIEYFELSPRFSAEKIIEDLSREMPQHQIDFYFQEKKSMFSRENTSAVARKDGIFIGLIVLSKHNCDGSQCIYINTLLIAERFQSQSVSFKLISTAFQAAYDRHMKFPDYIFMTTYNPITYCMMRWFCSDKEASAFLYPSLVESENDAAVTIANKIALELHPTRQFNSAHGVIKGGAGNISKHFWPSYPASRDQQVNNYFKKHLADDDRLLCIIFCHKQSDKNIVISNLELRPPGYALPARDSSSAPNSITLKLTR